MMKRRITEIAAFTLIEVMVVTGIMMSEANNYGDVKRLAYQTDCKNNLMQLYQALLMYDMNNGGLPKAAFFPKHPKGDPDSLELILDAAYRPSLVCPVFPSAIKEKGLTYLYNDSLGGQSLDMIPDAPNTWLLMEMNAVSPEIPMPHPGGFNILYANGQVRVSKTIPKVFEDLQKKAAAEKKAQAPEAQPGAGSPK